MESTVVQELWALLVMNEDGTKDFHRYTNSPESGNIILKHSKPNVSSSSLSPVKVRVTTTVEIIDSIETGEEEVSLAEKMRIVSENNRQKRIDHIKKIVIDKIFESAKLSNTYVDLDFEYFPSQIEEFLIQNGFTYKCVVKPYYQPPCYRISWAKIAS